MSTAVDDFTTLANMLSSRMSAGSSDEEFVSKAIGVGELKTSRMKNYVGVTRSGKHALYAMHPSHAAVHQHAEAGNRAKTISAIRRAYPDFSPKDHADAALAHIKSKGAGKGSKADNLAMAHLMASNAHMGNK